MMNYTLQKLTLRGAAGAIEAALYAVNPDETTPRGLAVVAHPHPLFGGTMDNKVVQTTARAFAQSGWNTLRFNFRGVGGSEGGHDEGEGEMQDLLEVIQQMAPQGPLALAGFSFGAAVAARALAQLWAQRPPEKAVFVGLAVSRLAVPALPAQAQDCTLLIHGEQDDTVELTALLDWARPQALPVMVVPGCGHFFHGHLPVLKNLVLRHLR